MATTAGNSQAGSRLGDVDALRRDAPAPAVPARRADRLSHRHVHSGAGHRPGARWRASSTDQEGTILGIVQHVLGRRAASACPSSRMGVMPYISASIIVQMMAMVVPSLACDQRKEGESGRRKLTQFTRYGTVVPGAVPVVRRGAWRCRTQGIVIDPGSQFVFVATRHADHRHHVPDVARRADHRARHRQRHLDDHPRAASSRACRPPSAARSSRSATGEMNPAFAIMLLARDRARSPPSCVFVERGQRRIPVNYAKRQVGRAHVRGPDHPPAVQAQHVGRDPADLRLEPAAVPGDDRELRSARARPAGLAADVRRGAAAAASRCTCCCTAA